MRHAQPVEDGMFRHADPAHRPGLGSLQLAEYPFDISIRCLEDKHLVEAGVGDQTVVMKKRQNETDVNSAAKRSPTPERAHGGRYDSAPAPVGLVPWAAAQSRVPGQTPPPLPSQSSHPSLPTPPTTSAELTFGDRISA